MEKITVPIHTDYIQLDQLLKLANIISTGGQIKFFIDDDLIKVNHLLCSVKRKKIYSGDFVEVKDIAEIKVVSE